MPAVLVLILCVVHAGIRREGIAVADASTMTASELITALRLARDVEDAQTEARRRPFADAPEPATRAEANAPPHEADENVTAFVAARGKKD